MRKFCSGASAWAAGRALPTGGRAFLSVRDHDKLAIVPIARHLAALGFELVATDGTARALASGPEGLRVLIVGSAPGRAYEPVDFGG